MADVSVLLDKTLVSVERKNLADEDDWNRYDAIDFELEDGSIYRMYHEQDCCEYVHIDDLNGDLQSLVGSKILVADEATSENSTPEGLDSSGADDSYTWTFYRFATIKGFVDIRWFGTSNGYYSESVSFEKIN